MSFLSIAPDMVAGASENLADLGSALRSATATAATQTTSIAAPAADEVSAAITALLGTHARGFHAASAKAAAFHDDFVNLLKGGAAQYVGTEAASDTSLSGNYGLFSYAFNQSATGASGNITFYTPFRPSLSFSATQNASGAALKATGTFHTPVGTVNWLEASGSATSTTNGGFTASLSGHSPFGPPLAFHASGTPINTDTEVGETLKASGGIHTPFGDLNIFKATGQAVVTTDGGFSGHISAQSPGGSEALSLTGKITDGGPVITGGSISIDGITFSF
ncbi:PE family protein [Mycobacterium conspicuum]|uniref:Uncharacterized protein n=1 Tax=Mycobacterium conspicuum TaxID=44010 RepID=A0A1X1T288_9MYCO|nr:PE family protein [Mycobacterium conspicuum]ORV38375.1 hypothetical protein AWC00_19835 [Mycobacterium conspicuum]BBZ39680.1 hypothetical protein MCNS_27430 [Mycobacterium conspicuum]